MKQLIDAFKSARKIELFIISACLFALTVCCFGGTFQKNTFITEDEQRIERILSSIENAGRVEVMITSNDEGEKGGALVVAQGADKIEVVLKLQQAVHTLTGLDINRIEVVESMR